MKHAFITLLFVANQTFSQSIEESKFAKCSYWVNACNDSACVFSGTAFIVYYKSGSYLVSNLHLIAEVDTTLPCRPVKNPERKRVSTLRLAQRVDEAKYWRIFGPLYDSLGMPLFRYVKASDGKNIDIFVLRLDTIKLPYSCIIDSAMISTEYGVHVDSVFSYGYGHEQLKQKSFPVPRFMSGKSVSLGGCYPDIMMHWDMNATHGCSGAPVYSKTKKGIQLVGLLAKEDSSLIYKKVFVGGFNTKVIDYIVHNYDLIRYDESLYKKTSYDRAGPYYRRDFFILQYP